MVYGHGELQPQQAVLKMIHDSKAILIGSQSVPRSFCRMLWPCGICGGSGHSIDHCPAYDSAAMSGLDQAEGSAAGGASTEATVGRKAKKRFKQAAKRAKAENATAATNGGSSTAADELGATAAKGVAAPDAASVVDSADGGATDASKHTEHPQQEATAQGVPVPAAASVVDGASGGTTDAVKDAQQPEQKEGAKQGCSSGGDGNKTDDADSKQVRCCSDVQNAGLSATTG